MISLVFWRYDNYNYLIIPAYQMSNKPDFSTASQKGETIHEYFNRTV